jgi:hypothetical protein
MGSSGASDDTTIQGVGSAQYNAQREQVQPSADNLMGKTAKKYGIDFTGSYWPKGWINAYTVKAAFDRCKYPCAPAAFEKATESLGTFTVAGSPNYGPLILNPQRHWSNTAVQYFTWDPAKSAVVTSGDIVPLQKGGTASKSK